MKHDVEVTEAGLELAEPEAPPFGHPLLVKVDRALRTINRLIMIPCMIALVASALVLTHSVVTRYFLKLPTDWQDEMAIFLLVGATFFSAAYVQSFRGHVGIQALAAVLPAGVNHVRMIVVDLASFAFCAFFCWKSWTLFLEALHEGQTTTSTWGPPLWIPYCLMAAGMTLLSAQLLIELLSRITPARGAP
jgi:TRAP-type C4-dicarboxylate transport system permease small subunit